MSFFAALPFIQAGTSGLKYLLDRQKMNKTNRANEQALQTANLQSAISQSGRAPRQFQANLQEFKPGAMSNFLGAVGTAAGLAQTGKALYDQGQRAAAEHAQNMKLGQMQLDSGQRALDKQKGADFFQANAGGPAGVARNLPEAQRPGFMAALAQRNQGEADAYRVAEDRARDLLPQQGMALALRGESLPADAPDEMIVSFYETKAAEDLRDLQETLTQARINQLSAKFDSSKWQTAVGQAKANMHRMVAGGEVTPEQAVAYVNDQARTAGQGLTDTARDSLLGQYMEYAARINLPAGSMLEIGSATKVQKMAAAAMEKLDDPVVYDSIGKLKGARNRVEAWLTGEGTMPEELIAFRQAIGFVLDEVQRDQSGAAIPDTEKSFYRDLLGFEDISPRALATRLAGTIEKYQQAKDALALGALQNKYGGTVPPAAMERYRAVYGFEVPRIDLSRYEIKRPAGHLEILEHLEQYPPYR